jgi:hypothetical protein
MTDGELFWVVTNGRRTMPAYRFQVPEGDRWAIVTYVRALQRTTSATISDVRLSSGICDDHRIATPRERVDARAQHHCRAGVAGIAAAAAGWQSNPKQFFSSTWSTSLSC